MLVLGLGLSQNISTVKGSVKSGFKKVFMQICNLPPQKNLYHHAPVTFGKPRSSSASGVNLFFRVVPYPIHFSSCDMVFHFLVSPSPCPAKLSSQTF